MKKLICILAFCLLAVGCGKSNAGTADEPAQHAPAGDPAKLSKVAADASAISAMLKDRFGEATARNLQVAIEDMGGGKKVTLSGEVVNDEIRQAIMKELEARVTDMKSQDFRLEIAGPIRQVFSFPARAHSHDPIAYAPDLSLVVTREGYIYELATGRRINRMAMPDEEVFSMAISPDGKTLATGHLHGGILLWELPLGRNPRVLCPFSQEHLSQRAAALAFTKDSKSLVSVNSRKGEVMMWDLAKGSSKTIGAHILETESHGVSDTYYVAVSPDAKLIATGNSDENFVILWDVAARSRKATLFDRRVRPEALAFSHNGRTLAIARDTGDKRGVTLYDVATGKDRVLARDEDSNISDVQFTPDDRLLAACYSSKGIGLWDVNAGKEWQSLDDKKVGSNSAVAFSPDGAVMAARCDLRPQCIRLWDVSRHPGNAGAGVHMPPILKLSRVEDDKLCRIIENAIRHEHAPENVETLTAELQDDGSIVLTGKVSDNETKKVAQRTAEILHPDEPGNHELNKIINKLEVTGRYVKPERTDRRSNQY